MGPDRDDSIPLRGLRLAGTSLRLIRKDPALMALGFAILCVSVIASAATVRLQVEASGAALTLLGSIVSTYVATFIASLGVGAIACAANASLDGEPLRAREALQDAWLSRPVLALWSALATGLALLVSLLAHTSIGMALVAWLLFAAWSFFFVFVIPKVVLDGADTREAISESAALARRRWTALLSGGVALVVATAAAGFLSGVLMALGAGGLRSAPGWAALLLVVGAIGLVAVLAAAFAVGGAFAVAVLRDGPEAPGGEPLGVDEMRGRIATIRPFRRHLALRVAAVLAATLVVATSTIVLTPQREARTNTEQLASEGYFYTYPPAGSEMTVGPGAPVVYEERMIGTVVSSQLDGSRVVIWYRTEPELGRKLVSCPSEIGFAGGRSYLRLGPPADEQGLNSPV